MIDNTLSALWHARSHDTPAKRWWRAPIWHDAIGRALHIDRTQEGGVYALAPFRLTRIDGQARILAAYPAPRLFTPPDPDWLAIETVLAWNPTDNTVEVLADPQPQLVGSWAESGTLYADPRAFFQAWAQKRAGFAVQRQMYAGKAWATPPTELDLAPGMLMVGEAKDIRWAPSTLPERIECVGVEAKTVNRAILRAARLPRLSDRPSEQTSERVAA